MEKGGLHLNARHSQDFAVGSGMWDSSRSCQWMTARPPPWPVLLAASR